MMNKQQRIEEMLKSIKTPEQVEIDPYLVTRAEAKLGTSGNDKNKLSPRWAFLMVLGMLMIITANITVWKSVSQPKGDPAVQQIILDYGLSSIDPPFFFFHTN